VLTIIVKSRIYNGPFATRQLIKNDNIHLKIRMSRITAFVPYRIAQCSCQRR